MTEVDRFQELVRLANHWLEDAQMLGMFAYIPNNREMDDIARKRTEACARQLLETRMEGNMKNIEELHILVKRLDGLLKDPHPGLFSWQGAYRRSVKELLSFWGAVIEPGQVHYYSPHEDNEE